MNIVDVTSETNDLSCGPWEVFVKDNRRKKGHIPSLNEKETYEYPNTTFDL